MASSDTSQMLSAREPVVVDAARAHAYDLYISALMAPKAARADLIALAAFEGETARIPQTVTEPLLGEIRLRWWRDAIVGEESGSNATPVADRITGNPIADHMIEVVRRRDLNGSGIVRSIEARDLDLGLQSVRDVAELCDYVDAVEGEAARRRAQMLQVPRSADEFLAIAARAIGLARVACETLSITESQPQPGWIGLDRQQIIARAGEALAQLRPMAPTAKRHAQLAILPVALVGPQLRACEAHARARLEGAGDDNALRRGITPLGRFLRLWWAARTGRF